MVSGGSFLSHTREKVVSVGEMTRPRPHGWPSRKVSAADVSELQCRVGLLL